MARKQQLSIQDTVETNEEFEAYLETHHDVLICMEVYSDFCGNCQATMNAVKKGKLEIGGDNVAMVKAASDKIDALIRFRNKSEPCFIFIQKGKLTRAMFGANGIELCRIIEEELDLLKKENETGLEVPKWNVEEMLPTEAAKIEEDMKLEEEHLEAETRLKTLTLAARKRRVCERMGRSLKRYNYIMFWPHCHQAHYDLYEKWDYVNINVAAKDTFQLNEETIKEALYMSDVDPNEACVHALLTGEVLVTVFKMFETDNRDFVEVLRQALYEDVPVPKEDLPPEKQLPPIPAFERYATISKSAREVRRDRYNAKMAKLRQEQEERERLEAEQARLARQAEEDRIAAEKQKAEEARMARIQAGLPEEPEPEPNEEAMTDEGLGEEATTVTEGDSEAPPELAEGGLDESPAPEQEPEPVVEEFHSDVELEDEEFIPPGGLFVPGLYCPANEYSKVNGLAHFFPKIVSMVTEIESENLPPHVLVMFTVDKRYEVNEIVNQYRDEIINMGIFVGENPYEAEHVAYTIKQYDKMERLRRHRDRFALMVSRKRSLPLLQLAGFNPVYISSDSAAGERDCLTLFPVGYGDDYEEEESVKDEQVVAVVKEASIPVVVASEPEVVEEEEEEDEEEMDF